jgi:uncharacterized protein (DUF488 family)
MEQKTIWTLGHSTHPIDVFVSLLTTYEISVLVDVRRYPGSRRFPQYNREYLSETLKGMGIIYHHMPDLGGRRTPRPDSKNSGWRVAAFRGYADYMETEPFFKSVSALEDLAVQTSTAIMCSEAVWWSCHRALIGDYLKWKGWKVMHIMSESKAQEHPYTKPAKIFNDTLVYSNHEELDFTKRD